jgi:hypothetical protein
LSSQILEDSMTIRLTSFAALALALIGLAAGCSSYGSPAARPGLGTAWGETRHSGARSTTFDRDQPDRPASLAMLHYDDQDGLRAQAGSLTGASRVEGVEMLDGQVRVRLLDASGHPLPHFNRNERDYVQGHRGDRYVIEVDNRGRDRFEAVATVDGLDVMDGERGALDKRGYVVPPFGTVHIDGFRKNMQQVAAFRFGTVDDSYAARKGDDANVGVVAVAVFVERGWQPPGRALEAERRRNADPFPGQFATPPPPRWPLPGY